MPVVQPPMAPPGAGTGSSSSSYREDGANRLQCAATQSLRAASIRDCQPGPPDLKCSITSGERRSVVLTFFGAFCGPRARIVFARPGNASAKGIALAKSSAVNSGLLLTASISALVYPGAACFGSVMAGASILRRDHQSGEEGPFAHIGKVDPVLDEVRLPFRFIPYNDHGFLWLRCDWWSIAFSNYNSPLASGSIFQFIRRRRLLNILPNVAAGEASALVEQRLARFRRRAVKRARYRPCG